MWFTVGDLVRTQAQEAPCEVVAIKDNGAVLELRYAGSAFTWAIESMHAILVQSVPYRPHWIDRAGTFPSGYGT